MSRLQKLLWAAEHPIVLAWRQPMVGRLQRPRSARFAERFALPVATTFRRAHLFDPAHPCYAGDLGIGANPKLWRASRRPISSCWSAAGWASSPRRATRSSIFPRRSQTFVHVHPDAEELGRVYRPHLAINATPTAFAAALEGIEPPAGCAGATRRRWPMPSFSPGPTADAVPGAVNLGEIIAAPARQDSGGCRDLQRRRQFLDLGAPLCALSPLRYPACTDLRLHGLRRARGGRDERLAPERMVIAFAGDGDFLMTGQEFATAVQYELPVIIVVVDNGMYGTIRMHQERHYPGREVATDLKNPDFAAYARSFGGYGATVESTADFFPAFEAARKSGLPAILHVKVDPEALTPAMSLSAIREKALAAQGRG